MKILAIFLFNFTILLLSCNNNYRKVVIDWIVSCDISNIDFNETPILIEYFNKDKTIEQSLIPNITKYFNLYHTNITGTGKPGNIYVCFYPNIINNNYNRQNILNYTKKIEICVFSMWPIEERDSYIKLYENKRAVAYYYRCEYDSSIYFLFSKDNTFTFDNLNSVDENISIEEIIIKIEDGDIYYNSESYAPFFSSFDNYGGYIIKSSSDGSFFLTEPEF
jgi:hypothetical protein